MCQLTLTGRWCAVGEKRRLDYSFVLLNAMQNTVNAEAIVNATVRLERHQTDLAVSEQIVRSAEGAEQRVSYADKSVVCCWRGKAA